MCRRARVRFLAFCREREMLDSTLARTLVLLASGQCSPPMEQCTDIDPVRHDTTQTGRCHPEAFHTNAAGSSWGAWRLPHRGGCQRRCGLQQATARSVQRRFCRQPCLHLFSRRPWGKGTPVRRWRHGIRSFERLSLAYPGLRLANLQPWLCRDTPCLRGPELGIGGAQQASNGLARCLAMLIVCERRLKHSCVLGYVQLQILGFALQPCEQITKQGRAFREPSSKLALAFPSNSLSKFLELKLMLQCLLCQSRCVQMTPLLQMFIVFSLLHSKPLADFTLALHIPASELAFVAMLRSLDLC
mmetsp:Transcript_20653/g.57027  ORF Transcript_20653/g.57027 Transcript_20653/m.57027 type:complete len:302 (+) Transcript_20653:1650-2555(+)